MMLISLIAAVAEDGVIGRHNGLPWRLPADLKWFKSHTMGKPVVMGRVTCESIGKPLPGRVNIAMTRSQAPLPPGFLRASTPDEAIAHAAGAPEIMIGGGSQVFAAFLPRAGRIYLTRVHARVDGDAFFPDIDEASWVERYREEHPADDKNAHAMTFLILERKPDAGPLPDSPPAGR